MNRRGGAPVRLTRSYWIDARPSSQGSLRDALLRLHEEDGRQLTVLGQRHNRKRIRASVFTTARRLGMRVTSRWSDKSGGLMVREVK